MKTYIFLFFLSAASNHVFSQGFYPLHQGNIWQYQASDPFNPMPLEAKIVGDTTLSNGIKYVVHTGFTLGSNFLRQDSVKVFAYDRLDSAEYLLFDFAAHPKDTISHHKGGSRTIVLTNKYADTTVHRTYWLFVEYQGSGPGSYDFFNWTIEDSVGLVSLLVEPGNWWHLTGARINGVTIGTITTTPSQRSVIPPHAYLYQNYPNPFNPSTTFRLTLPSEEYVVLKVFDVLGNDIVTIADGKLLAGEHLVAWNAANTSAGVYFYRLQTKNSVQTKKLMLLK